jgi:hypothetical protein
MERRKAAVLAIVVIVATSGVGFAVGSRITSPAEVALRTASPEPSPILVPVEERVLSTEVVTRGTGRFGSPQKLSVPPSSLKPSAGLIASLPPPGTELAEGDAVASASGRPLFVLAGVRPMSRDLGPGLSGDDVHQLEEALARLGFDPGPVDGIYDELTAAGVEAWYLAAGYSPFAATDEQLATIRAREADRASAAVDVIAAADAVTTADAALTTARATAATAVRRAASSVRAVDRAVSEADAANVMARQEVVARQSALDRAKFGQAGAPATPARVRAAQADVAAARSNEASTQVSGQRMIADAQAVVDQAPARLDVARSAAASADAAAAADLAAKQAAFDEVDADPGATDAQLAAAQSELTSAVSNAARIRADGLQAVADATTLLASAPGALDQARAIAASADDLAAADVAAKELALFELTSPSPPASADVATADNELAIAVGNVESVRLAGERLVDDATVASADATADIATTSAAVVAAEGSLASAQATVASRSDLEVIAAREADLVHRRAGVQVPADEVAFVASAPVRVAEVLLVIGDPATGSLMTVTDSVVHVDAGLAVSDAGLVSAGMAVRLDEPALGITVDGVVASVADAPGTNGVDGFHVYVSVDVADPPTNLVGASVRLSIPVESSGSSVLAVPLSALTLAADGRSQIERSSGAGTEFVAVVPGLSAAGYVAISSSDKTVRAGDLVVVGVDQPKAPSDTASVPDPTAVPDAPVGSTSGVTTIPSGGGGG